MDAKKLKVVLVGNTAVGKTSLIQRYVNHQFCDGELPTVQPKQEAATHTVKTGSNVELAIWDTAGQEKYQALGRILFRDTAVGCICYHPLDSSSAFDVQRWRSDLLEQSSGCKVVLVATKNDLISDMGVLEKRPSDVAEYSGIDTVFVTSAKTGEGVDDLFDWIARWAIEAAPPEVPVGMEVAPPATESSAACQC
jgi:small GTP-binding protein